MAHPGLQVTTWATSRGYARADRPAADALVIPTAEELALGLVEVDSDGFPVFDLMPSRGVGDEGPSMTGIDEQGFPIIDPGGVPSGREATVSVVSGGYLNFAPLEG